MISSLEFGIGLDFCTPFKASPIRFLTSNMEMFSFNMYILSNRHPLQVFSRMAKYAM